ncbi:sodium:calcium antiporter [Streptococcaceae bacterium ESL0687]|nr:sodium:calcium antiporter [Streptococcaceae bacterium ESL0687]
MYGLMLNLPVIILVFIFLISLYALSKFSDLMVENSVVLAENLAIPKVVIGATIVSLGTTLPEVSTAVIAILNGSSDLALGNAVGSVMSNITLIVGVSALIAPLPVTIQTSKSYNFFLAASLIPIVASYFKGYIDQWVGFVMLIFMIYYIVEQFRNSPLKKRETNLLLSKKTNVKSDGNAKLIVSIILFALLVAASASLLVASIQVFAERINIPQTVIGVIVVALGTSLPELTTAIQATRKGQGAIAIGNILGANILNLLLVLGTGVAMSSGGIGIPSIYLTAIFPMLLFVLFLFALSIYNSKIHVISKKEGIFLLILYVIFISIVIVK